MSKTDILKIINTERYKRNILIPEVNKEGQKKILKARVLICGSGGLGSGVIANLASLGVGKIGIVDNDNVEMSNLNRQFIHNLNNINKPKVLSAKEWIKNYNKDIKVETYYTRLNDKNYLDIAKNYDIIADCFDSFESKFLLNDISLTLEKPLIHAGVSEFRGQTITIIPKKTSCLRCIFPNADIKTPIDKAIVSPTVSTIASIQSMEILKLIISKGELLTNKILTFDGLNMRFKIINIKKSSSCICSL